MKQRRCGNCNSFIKGTRYSLCDSFDARTRADNRFARKCPAYVAVKFVRLDDRKKDTSDE